MRTCKPLREACYVYILYMMICNVYYNIILYNIINGWYNGQTVYL